jgi:hypothetical protein
LLKVGLIEKRLLVSPVLDLVNEDIARPSEPLGGPDVEFALGCVFPLLQNHDVVGPRDFSHQRCEFLSKAVALMEKLHSPQVSCRKPGGHPEIRHVDPEQGFATTDLPHVSSSRRATMMRPISLYNVIISRLTSRKATSCAERIRSFISPSRDSYWLGIGCQFASLRFLVQDAFSNRLCEIFASKSPC